MMKFRTRILFPGLFGLIAVGAVIVTAVWANQSIANKPYEAKPYMRVIEDEDTGISQLQLQVRLFAPSDNSAGPTVALTGAIHVADKKFYALLQTFLEAQDLIMYEGVKPSGFGNSLKRADANTNTVKRKQTEMRIRFLATVLQRLKNSETQPDNKIQNQHKNQYPPTLDQLADEVTKITGRRVGEWVKSSEKDAWGNPLIYTIDDSGTNYQLISYGADGQPGGEDDNADLSFADQKPLTDAETGGDPGIQRRLAKALGLVFQLDAMNEDGSNFLNVDMSIDEIEDEIAKQGGDASFLFSMLNGSGFMAGVMKFGLAILEKSPMMQAMAKLTLMETMKTVGEKGMMNMRGMPANMKTIFDVIVNERNQVVIDTLKDTLKEDRFGPDSTIAIIYGAGHLHDLEKQLVQQCNYKPVGGFWVPAITVDIKKSGLTTDQVKMIRSMVKMMQ